MFPGLRRREIIRLFTCALVKESIEREKLFTHFVVASIILIVTGFTPGIPGVTSEANTDVR